MAQALKKEMEFNGHEIVIERPTGERRTVLTHANPIRSGSGKVLGGVNVLVDITAHKNAEDTLRRADRARNEFLAILAHELRNPLAPIQNAVGILQLDGGLGPQSQWALSAVDRQMRQMTRVIEDLVDIARISSNRLELRRETIELSTALRAAVETTSAFLQAGGQEFDPSGGADLPRRRPDPADPGDLESAEQRGQVHAARWSHLADRRAA
jgi:signal transduction histidine kinase